MSRYYNNFGYEASTISPYGNSFGGRYHFGNESSDESDSDENDFGYIPRAAFGRYHFGKDDDSEEEPRSRFGRDPESLERGVAVDRPDVLAQ